MKKLIFTIILAAVLWSIMFLPVTAPHINFWWKSSIRLSLIVKKFLIAQFACNQAGCVFV